MSFTEREKSNYKMRFLKMLHLFVTFGIFLVIYLLYYHSGLSPESHVKADYILCATYFCLLIIFAKTFESYNVGYVTVGDLIYSQSLVAFFSGMVAYVMICLVFMALVNPIQLICIIALQLVWNILWSFLANKIYFSIYGRRRTALIYRNQRDLERLNDIHLLERKFEIVKRIENPKTFAEVASQLEGIESICVAGIEASVRNGLAKYCVENGVYGYFAPHIGDIILSGGRYVRNFSVPIRSVKAALPNPEFLFAKRVFDIVVSFIGLVVLSPIMLIVAIAIKLDDGGPVFYKQVRLTKGRKQFRILKFRSMRTDAENDGKARLATEDDERITKVGKIIRACRMDELPQIINILKGDMSIVGPRPERPEIAEEYEKALPDFRLRLQVKAGLTGYAQVYGKYNTNPYDKLQFDLMYINQMDTVEDLKIMFNTVKILFLPESTEGVKDGQLTALSEQESNAELFETQEKNSDEN